MAAIPSTQKINLHALDLAGTCAKCWTFPLARYGASASTGKYALAVRELSFVGIHGSPKSIGQNYPETDKQLAALGMLT
jgi:hypothetical protein